MFYFRAPVVDFHDSELNSELETRLKLDRFMPENYNEILNLDMLPQAQFSASSVNIVNPVYKIDIDSQIQKYINELNLIDYNEDNIKTDSKVLYKKYAKDIRKAIPEIVETYTEQLDNEDITQGEFQKALLTEYRKFINESARDLIEQKRYSLEQDQESQDQIISRLMPYEQSMLEYVNDIGVPMTEKELDKMFIHPFNTQYFTKFFVKSNCKNYPITVDYSRIQAEEGEYYLCKTIDGKTIVSGRCDFKLSKEYETYDSFAEDYDKVIFVMFEKYIDHKRALVTSITTDIINIRVPFVDVESNIYNRFKYHTKGSEIEEYLLSEFFCSLDLDFNQNIKNTAILMIKELANTDILYNKFKTAKYKIIDITPQLVSKIQIRLQIPRHQVDLNNQDTIKYYSFLNTLDTVPYMTDDEADKVYYNTIDTIRTKYSSFSNNKPTKDYTFTPNIFYSNTSATDEYSNNETNTTFSINDMLAKMQSLITMYNTDTTKIQSFQVLVQTVSGVSHQFSIKLSEVEKGKILSIYKDVQIFDEIEYQNRPMVLPNYGSDLDSVQNSQAALINPNYFLVHYSTISKARGRIFNVQSVNNNKAKTDDIIKELTKAKLRKLGYKNTKFILDDTQLALDLESLKAQNIYCTVYLNNVILASTGLDNTITVCLKSITEAKLEDGTLVQVNDLAKDEINTCVYKTMIELSTINNKNTESLSVEYNKNQEFIITESNLKFLRDISSCNIVYYNYKMGFISKIDIDDCVDYDWTVNLLFYNSHVYHIPLIPKVLSTKYIGTFDFETKFNKNCELFADTLAFSITKEIEDIDYSKSCMQCSYKNFTTCECKVHTFILTIADGDVIDSFVSILSAFKKQDLEIVFYGYNSAKFDKFLLLNNQKVCSNVTEILKTDNILRSFKIYNHLFYDFMLMIGNDSLSKHCSNYKTTPRKQELDGWDHDTLQDLYRKSGYKDEYWKNLHLNTYNDDISKESYAKYYLYIKYDTECLLSLMAKFKINMDKIYDKLKYTKVKYNMSTKKSILSSSINYFYPETISTIAYNLGMHTLNVQQISLGAPTEEEEQIIRKSSTAGRTCTFNLICDPKYVQSLNFKHCDDSRFEFNGESIKYNGQFDQTDVASLYPSNTYAQPFMAYFKELIPSYCMYPTSNETQKYIPQETFPKYNPGFYFCTFDQSKLFNKFLPEKTIDKDQIMELNWQTENIIQAWITTTEIQVLQMYDCPVTVHHGFYYTKYSANMLKPFFETVYSQKAHQDYLKNTKDPEYNSGFRQATKTIICAWIGKCYQKHHHEKTLYTRKDSFEQVDFYMKNENIQQRQYNSVLYEFIGTPKKDTKNNKPSYIAAFNWAYSRTFMYVNLIEPYKIWLHFNKNTQMLAENYKIMYSDTDSILQTHESMLLHQKLYPEMYKKDTDKANALGQLDIEYSGTGTVYCIAKKFYAIFSDTATKTRIKGIMQSNSQFSTQTLSKEHIKQMKLEKKFSRFRLEESNTAMNIFMNKTESKLSIDKNSKDFFEQRFQNGSIICYTKSLQRSANGLKQLISAKII